LGGTVYGDIILLGKSLAIKLIFWIAIILVLTIGIFAYININLQRKHLMEDMEQNAVRLSQTIERSIKYEMLTARTDQVQRTLEDIGRQEGIEQIRIFDKKGKIIAADSMEEVGLLIDRKAEACYTCHKDREPLERLSTSDRTRIFKLDEGYRVLGVINPIYNEPNCYDSACHFHSKNQNVLGVMDILVSLARFDEQIGTGRKQIVVYFLLTFLFISAGSSLFIFLFVNTPIHKLIEGTRKIAEGDLNYRIGSYRADEVGKLGLSFDKMTAELKKSREEIEQWNLKLKNEVKNATEKLRKTNDKLNKANEQLRELDHMKSDFMRRMEHGSRSHLAVIQSCLGLAQREYFSELAEQPRDLIKTAHRRSSALLDLLDDILILSYRKSAKAVYHLEPVQLADIMRKVVDELNAQAQKKNIMINVRIPQDFPQLVADRKALSELFSNLVGNAVKYTREHGAVSISAKQKKGFIEIEVSDTGIGIASEHLAEIFDEFYRAPNAKSYKVEGTGLGLAIVKEIVKAHSGELKVKSELGKGSTFTILFPKKRQERK
jgi:two-component system NtrC family sensor kinase